MPTTTITRENFAETIKSDGIVLLDFWAEWCGPCRGFAPVYEKVSEDHPDVVFGKVDTEADQELAGMMGISSIPTVMAFRDGIMVFNNPGALSADDLGRLVQAIRELDMDEVHATAMAKAQHLTTVDAERFDELCQQEATTVIDVRTPEEFAAGHLPRAINIDATSPDFVDLVKALDPRGHYAIYCHAGVRSAQAKQVMYASGIDTVADLEGGIDAWTASGRRLVLDQ